jgi:hypothetical protein
MTEKKKKFAVMEATVVARGSLNEVPAAEKNNNLSTGSITILKHTFFALAALEFFKNGREHLFADDIRVKDAQTGREFSFSLKAAEVK